MARVTININQAAVNRLASDPSSPVYRRTVAVGAAVSAVAKVKANVDTGRLRQSIDYEVISRGPRVIARVLCPVAYAYYVHEGRGEVRPKRARMLAWRGRNGEWIFAKKVRAYPGNPFLAEAVRIVTGKSPTRGR